MALSKDGYRDAQQLTTKVKVPITEEGKIATTGETAVSQKTYTITRANAGNGLTDNNKLFNFFIGMVDGSITTNSNTASVKWSV